MFQRIIEHAIKYGWLMELNEFDQLFHWLINQVTCNNTRKFIISFRFLDIVKDISCSLRVDLLQLNKIFEYLNASEWCQWECIDSYFYRHPPSYSTMWNNAIDTIRWNWDKMYGKPFLVNLKKIFDDPDKNYVMHQRALLLKKFIQNIHEMMIQSCHDLSFALFRNFKDNLMKGYIEKMIESKQENMKNDILALVYLCIDFENFKID